MEAFAELNQLLVEALNKPKLTNTQADILNIKDILVNLEEKYPDEVQLIRDVLDTIEE